VLGIIDVLSVEGLLEAISGFLLEIDVDCRVLDSVFILVSVWYDCFGEVLLFCLRALPGPLLNNLGA